MKKITLFFILAFTKVSAQLFPSPYCDITNADVEEITSINFAGANISNANTSLLLINNTTTMANVTPNQSYTIQVKGNSHGPYDNEYVAYIDWNHNNILNDTGEVFYIGLLNSTTGTDAATASVSIAVPSSAIAGNTRIRVIKVYTDQSDDFILNYDPCNITVEDTFFEETVDSFGQAIDFTLNVATLGINSFDKNALSVYPNPARNVLNISYKSDINDVKIYNLLGQEVLSETIKSSDFQLNTSELSTGTYVVKLFADQAQYSYKLIKE